MNIYATIYKKGGINLMDRDTLSKIIEEKINSVKIIDVHTHLYPPFFEKLLLRGLDELLTYHYLIAETLRYIPIDPDKFFALPKKEQSEIIWKTLFIERSPISEAAKGVITTLNEFGLDLEKRDLEEYRRFFSSLSLEEHIDLVFEKANVDYVVMTNDPLDMEEMNYWQNNLSLDPRFKPAMRLDKLLDFRNFLKTLRDKGYDIDTELNEKTIKELKRFLEDSYHLMNPLYAAISLPPDFKFPENSERERILREVILPFSEEFNIPLALMIGAKRRVNPFLREAGDGIGKGDITAIENLCREYPNNKFLVTMLSRENQHELCVTARKFSNLMIFGCWWFLNNPSLIKEITKMRIELLGFSFIPQHSDARVLDQLVYKWKHAKRVISDVLIEKYDELLKTGWVLKPEEIERDIYNLFRGNFIAFLEK